ncbi:MAG: DUF5615 family PIN-like protein [Patescibacteria group bacterium]
MTLLNMLRSASDNKVLHFLLDEVMPPRKNLPRLNKRGSCNIRHITHDYKKSGLTDKDVLRWAQKEHRILVTADKFFIKPKNLQKTIAVIRISGGCKVEEIDRRLVRLIRLNPSPDYYFGKILVLSDKKVISESREDSPRTYKY